MAIHLCSFIRINRPNASMALDTILPTTQGRRLSIEQFIAGQELPTKPGYLGRGFIKDLSQMRQLQPPQSFAYMKNSSWKGVLPSFIQEILDRTRFPVLPPIPRYSNVLQCAMFLLIGSVMMTAD